MHRLVRFIKYYYGDQVMVEEMAGACNTYGKDEKCIHNYGRKT